jgi:hypothetical protein
MSETGVKHRIYGLFVVFRKQDTATEDRIKEIAQAIWEYGGLIRRECPQCPKVIVNSREIAFRFREKAKDVSRALVLLQRSGRASPERADDWHLRM